MERARQKDIHAERLTPLDRAIAERAGAEGILCLKPSRKGPEGGFQRGHILARLKTLEALGLCAYRSPHIWQLKEGWKETLRALGMRNDIIN
jgi:hypothetical protein